MNVKQLADLMLRHVWRLHGTPKTITLDWGSIFTSQLTQELSQRLGVRLQPSTAYHPRTDGQLEIANKAVKQYLRHYVGYHQDDWEPLLVMAEFTYNNNDHLAIGVLPFQANYGFNPPIGGTPQADQCLPLLEAQMEQLAKVQDKLKACLSRAQERMKAQFN
jgi:hypothetical protein